MSTEPYVYNFETLLEPVAIAHTPARLLESLGLSLEAGTPEHKALLALASARQEKGYNDRLGRASLALACQRTLYPGKPFIALADIAYFPQGNRGSLRLSGTCKGQGFLTETRDVLSPSFVLPQALHLALCAENFDEDFSYIVVKAGSYERTRTPGFFSASLFFFDHSRAIGWRTTGIGPSPLLATAQAAADGYNFAADPRREQLLLNRQTLAAFAAQLKRPAFAA